MKSSGAKNKIIFFGNGALAEYALAALERDCEVVFHAHSKADLEEAVRLRTENPELTGVLASFGVLIPSSVLEVFEPEGILNIHPSLLPLYRGASPIESAILNGDTEYGVSVMKLAKAMDAGPIYNQASLEVSGLESGSGLKSGAGALPTKDYLYKTLAEMGASMALTLLKEHTKTGAWSEPTPQGEKEATFCSKFEKKDGVLDPASETAEQIYRKIVAFQGFPKAKFAFYGKNSAILEAHIAEVGETALLPLECADGRVVAVDRLQPDGKRPMEAKAFLNGVRK